MRNISLTKDLAKKYIVCALYFAQLINME